VWFPTQHSRKRERRWGADNGCVSHRLKLPGKQRRKPIWEPKMAERGEISGSKERSIGGSTKGAEGEHEGAEGEHEGAKGEHERAKRCIEGANR
jgi:hypothetical protein